MRSRIALVVALFMATAVQCSAEPKGNGMPAWFNHEKSCSPSNAGGCGSCGADYVQCGSNSCYNPKAGESCCQDQFACPANFNCSSTGQHCVSKNGPGGPDCDDDDKNSSTTATVASATPSTAASTFSGPPVLAVASTTGSNTTTYTTTVTSTATNTVTISATTVACGLSAATTGLPITGSVVSYGNSTTVALNTTTSTMSVTNVTVHPATNYNLTKPTSSINPPISGYKGAASGLQGRSSTSLFALGALIFMAALLI